MARTLLDAGARLTFGSDWPVVSLDPRLEIHMAVNRTTAAGEPAGGWLPGQKISLDEAIEGLTGWAAYASFEDDRKGRLAPGQLADVVVLSADIFTLPPSRVLEGEVAMTIFDGRVVYER